MTAETPSSVQALINNLPDTAFTNPKELRDAAEEVSGLTFVRVDVLRFGDVEAELLLDAAGDRVRVFARRSQPWHPFIVERILPDAA